MMQDNTESFPEETAAEHYLDVTSEVCPMTFVRAKLLLERMKSGEVATIVLNTGEPMENVPRAMREHGHVVLGAVPVDPARPSGPQRLKVRKA
jgi:TusA-related sulfurtransferase